MIDKIYLPNMRRIEFELTTECNLYCKNCNRSCGQARSAECISLEQAESFVEESISNRYYWDSIVLLGGEPTLHYDLFGIIEILYRYKEFDKRCKFEIVSNQFAEKTKIALNRLPEWISIRNEKKNSAVNLFSRCHEAPVDKLEEKCDFSTACQIAQISGMGFSRYGYYACGPAAAIDRVFGFDLGMKKLSEVNIVNIQKQMNTFCSLCGHFLDFRDDFTGNWSYEECLSTTWEEAYKRYNENPPKLKLYDGK